MKIFIAMVLTLFTGLALAATDREPPTEFAGDEPEEQVLSDSFGVRDRTGLEAIQEFNQTSPLKLKPWRPLHDFNSPVLEGDRGAALAPWLQKNFVFRGQKIAELDIRNPEHAQIFAKLVLEYIYQGWFSRTGRSDDHFAHNTHRTWCTTPWVVDGPGGRETVHGLTKELGLRANPVFPADGKLLFENTENAKRPAGWGVAYFNRIVCENYAQIFGTKSSLVFPPDFEKLNNADGFVSFKLHFNAMEGWQNYEPLKGAFTWHAHVVHESGLNRRSIREIPLIQLSVSIKDSRLKGTRADAQHWVMLAYTFDPGYFDSEMSLKDVPTALKKMRPMGIQTGFEAAFSQIFKGSKTNYIYQDQFIPHGAQAMLNGPADNNHSSCLGCHAAFNHTPTITKLFKATDFPGHGAWERTFYDTKTFDRVLALDGKDTDFNLQLFNAKERVKAWLEKRKAVEPK